MLFSEEGSQVDQKPVRDEHPWFDPGEVHKLPTRRDHALVFLILCEGPACR